MQNGAIDVRRLPPPRGGRRAVPGAVGHSEQVQRQLLGNAGAGAEQRRVLLGNRGGSSLSIHRPATSFEMRNGRLRRLSNEAAFGNAGRGTAAATVRSEQLGRRRNFPHLPDGSSGGGGSTVRKNGGKQHPATKGAVGSYVSLHLDASSTASSGAVEIGSGGAKHYSENTVPNPVHAFNFGEGSDIPQQNLPPGHRRRAAQDNEHCSRRGTPNETAVRPPLSPTNLEERQQARRQQQYRSNLPNMSGNAVSIMRGGPTGGGTVVKPIAVQQQQRKEPPGTTYSSSRRSSRTRENSSDHLRGQRAQVDNSAGLGVSLGASSTQGRPVAAVTRAGSEASPFREPNDPLVAVSGSGAVMKLEHSFVKWAVDVWTDQGPHHANEDRWIAVDNLESLAASGGLESAPPAGGSLTGGSLTSSSDDGCPRAFLRSQRLGRQPGGGGNDDGQLHWGARTALWGVFDGHGGSGASEYVRSRAAREVFVGATLNDPAHALRCLTGSERCWRRPSRVSSRVLRSRPSGATSLEPVQRWCSVGLGTSLWPMSATAARCSITATLMVREVKSSRRRCSGV
jgi:hypothetical protein